jgi:DNA-binding phage protein
MVIAKPPRTPSALIQALQDEAARRRLTAYAMAKVTGLSVSTITRTLTGAVSPTLTTVEALANALGLSLDLTTRG